MKSSPESSDPLSAGTDSNQKEETSALVGELVIKSSMASPTAPSQPHSIEDGTHAPSSSSTHKQLGVMDGAKFLVSYVVGAGIFTTVNDVQNNIGNMWVTTALWIFCGLLCLVGALCYAQLACILPGSGGEHIYMHHGFGVVGMRLFDWMSFIMLRPASNAYYAMKFVFFVTSLVKHDYILLWWEEILYGSAFIAFITLFSIVASALFDKAQKIFTYTKVFGLIAVIISGLAVLIYKPSIFMKNAKLESVPSAQRYGNFAQAICDAILTFDGWNAINPIAGRFKNPTAVIPKAIIYGTSFIIFIYLLVVMSYFLIQTDFSSKDTKTIFESITKELFSKKELGTYIGNPIICLAIFSATQAGIACSVDSFESAVVDGSLPKWLMKKSTTFGTHHYMLSIQAFISMLYIALSVGLQFAFHGKSVGSSDHASQFAVVPFCFFYVLSVIVLIKEMFKKNKLPNPGYKANSLFPFIFVLATVGLIGLLLGINFYNGFKKTSDADPSNIWRNVVMIGLVLLCLSVAFLVESPKGKVQKNKKKSKPASNQPQEPDSMKQELEELNTTAIIPPKLVESALLGGSMSESE